MVIGGVALRHGGPHVGRVLWCGHRRLANKASVAVIWYSNLGSAVVDGQTTLKGFDECQIVEMGDAGTLLINSRNPDALAAPHVRITARSTDSGTSWYDVGAKEMQLKTPRCQGDLLHSLQRNATYYSGATPDVINWTDARVNLSVRRAKDTAGSVYTDAVRVEDGPSAYSSLANLPSGAVGILYERGDDGCTNRAECGWDHAGRCPSCRVTFASLSAVGF